MPITQDRFIGALEGADALTQLIFSIHRICRADPQLMSDANSALAHNTDPIACDVIRELLALIESISVLMNNNSEVTSEMAAKVQGELRYFARMRKTNERAAYYQRMRRGAGEAPVQAQTEQTSTSWQPDIDKARRELEAEGRLAPRPEYVPRKEREAQTQAQQVAVPATSDDEVVMRDHAYAPDVVRTSVPTLAELNAEGIAKAGTDVL